MLTIFDFLKSITLKKPIDFDQLPERDRKGYNIFMINRYLSMDKRLINAISQIDKYSFEIFDRKMHYQFLYSIIPKGFIFFEYLKKDQEEKKKPTESHVKLLMEYLKIDKKTAILYMQFLNKDDIKQLKQIFGTNSKGTDEA